MLWVLGGFILLYELCVIYFANVKKEPVVFTMKKILFLIQNQQDGRGFNYSIIGKENFNNSKHHCSSFFTFLPFSCLKILSLTHLAITGICNKSLRANFPFDVKMIISTSQSEGPKRNSTVVFPLLNFM